MTVWLLICWPVSFQDHRPGYEATHLLNCTYIWYSLTEMNIVWEQSPHCERVTCHISSLQTMGGVFSGKEQDATRGIYALAGALTDHSNIALWGFTYPRSQALAQLSVTCNTVRREAGWEPGNEASLTSNSTSTLNYGTFYCLVLGSAAIKIFTPHFWATRQARKLVPWSSHDCWSCIAVSYHPAISDEQQFDAPKCCGWQCTYTFLFFSSSISCRCVSTELPSREWEQTVGYQCQLLWDLQWKGNEGWVAHVEPLHLLTLPTSSFPNSLIPSPSTNSPPS